MENPELLVPTRCLALLFYNFTQSDIDELSKLREFEYAWNKYTNTKAIKKIGHIPDTVFYELYTNTSYETQYAIMQRALDRFKKEACESIGVSLKLKDTVADLEHKNRINKSYTSIGFKVIDTDKL